MGKKRHAKDRAYLTTTEWKEEWGGYKAKATGTPFKRLPFYCCAISFQPFEDAVCTADGTCYDIVNAVPYVRKFHRHPVTGEPLELKDLIRLNFYKNADGEYACPVLHKVFTEHTHIVAVRSSGNVYCWEAIEELCLKPKNMRDLLTDEPFTRKDIIHIQDPLNLQARLIDQFDHVKKDLAVEDEEELERQRNDPLFSIKVVNEDTQRALAALNSKESEAAFQAGGGGKKAQAERLLAEATAATAAEEKEKDKAGGKAGNTAQKKQQQQQQQQARQPGMPDPRLRSERRELTYSFRPGAATWNTDEPGAGSGGKKGSEPNKFDPNAGRRVPPPYSSKFVESASTTGAASRAFTSSSMAIVTKNERLMVRVELQPKKKGYLRLHTSLGDLNIELHCDIAPRTCENFMALCEGGYYTGTAFHRSIKNFMIQGGDPTGTGKGGESIYGPTFKDEVDSRLLHSGRGVLSMANNGPATNGSQFFILYKSAHHLDYKHSVFGRVVGGLETLSLMEKVPTDDEDKPLQEISITGVTIFVNPYKELLEEEAKLEEESRKKKEKEEQGYHEGDEFGDWFTNPAGSAAAARRIEGELGGGNGGPGGVGKYLAAAASVGKGGQGAGGQAAKKQKSGGGGYGNFDAW